MATLGDELASLSLEGVSNTFDDHILDDSSDGLDSDSDAESIFSAPARARTDTKGSDRDPDTDNSSVSDDSDTASAISITTSRAYGEEPFDTFQTRALALARHTIWPSAAIEDIAVEKVREFYPSLRPTLLTHRPTNTQYLMRVPWSTGEPVQTWVAAVRLTKEHTSIPVFDTVMFDTTSNNPLGADWLIHVPPPSTSVLAEDVYGQLSHQHRCQLARHLGDIYRQLLDTRSPVPGKPVLALSSHHPVAVAPWSEMPLRATTNPTGLPFVPDIPRDPLPVTTADASNTYPISVPPLENDQPLPTLITTLLNRNISALSTLTPPPTARITILTNLLPIVSDLSNLGYFSNVPNVLTTHLSPDDIYVSRPTSSPDGDDTPVTIIGLIEWDDADFSPAFCRTLPPEWLWGWELYAWRMEMSYPRRNDDDSGDDDDSDSGEDDDSDSENDDDDSDSDDDDSEDDDDDSDSDDDDGFYIPVIDLENDAEAREIKAIFDEAAGPVYRRFAYNPVYDLARLVFHAAVEAVNLDSDYMAGKCESAVEKWEELKREVVEEGKWLPVPE